MMTEAEKRKIRVALCQRILPDFRLPVWEKLSQNQELDLTVFHGKGFGKGSAVSTKKNLAINTHLLSGVPVFRGKKYRVFHPALVPTVLNKHYDIVVSEGLTYFPNSFLLALACRLQGIPFILYETPPAGEETLPRKTLSPLYRKLASWLITYTSWAKKYYIDKGFPQDRITVALNTVDTTSVRKKLEMFLSERESLIRDLFLEGYLVVGYIGAVEARKCPDIIIRSVKKLIEEGIPAKALFIGDGPFRRELEEMIPISMNNDIILLGRHTDDAERYLQLCSAVVLPSQGGLAVPHALTCGIPCIATEDAEGPGIRDYIEDGVNGYILSGNIEEELPSKLRELYCNPERLESLRAGAKTSRMKFEVSGMISSIVTAIKEVHQNYYTENCEQ